MLFINVKFTDSPQTHEEDHATSIFLRDTAVELLMPGTVPEYSAHSGGKPYVRDGSFSYSFSHTDGCVVCAVAVPISWQGAEPVPETVTEDGIYLLSEDSIVWNIGCDVETVTADCHRGVANRFFSEAEKSRFSVSTEPEVEFVRIWTRKESRVKCTGEGLSALRGADTESPSEFRSHEVRLCRKGKVFICTVTVQPKKI